MAKGKATTVKPHAASVAKATRAASVRKDADRPYFNVMDSLNLALADLRSTVRALYLVDAHINDREDNDSCRDVLSRLLMADLGLVEDAERRAWAVVIEQKGGAL